MKFDIWDTVVIMEDNGTLSLKGQMGMIVDIRANGDIIINNRTMEEWFGNSAGLDFPTSAVRPAREYKVKQLLEKLNV